MLTAAVVVVVIAVIGSTLPPLLVEMEGVDIIVTEETTEPVTSAPVLSLAARPLPLPVVEAMAEAAPLITTSIALVSVSASSPIGGAINRLLAIPEIPEASTRRFVALLVALAGLSMPP